MSRILIIIVTTLISMIANGQDSIFDKKVQQLFFNVDVDSYSPSLVDKFAKVRGIAYKKPRSYLSWAFNGKLWIHTFKFTAQPYLTNRFDTGIIELEVVEIGKEKRLKDITWKLQFDKKEDAVKVFEEIKNYFSETQAIKKIYSSTLILETVEFTDKKAKKYPYVMFSLFDKTRFEKKYQVIFSLDNDMHYEN